MQLSSCLWPSLLGKDLSVSSDSGILLHLSAVVNLFFTEARSFFRRPRWTRGWLDFTPPLLRLSTPLFRVVRPLFRGPRWTRGRLDFTLPGLRLSTSFLQRSDLWLEERVGLGDRRMLLQLASSCQPLFQRSAPSSEDRVGPGNSGMLLHRATVVNPSFQKGPASYQETAWDPGGTAIR